MSPPSSLRQFQLGRCAFSSCTPPWSRTAFADPLPEQSASTAPFA
ncbi:hypothetical protein [Actinocorallia libanotica]